MSGGLAHTSTSLLALFLDPTSLDIQDPGGQHARYDLASGKFGNAIPNAFVSVSSNVEVAVIPALAGTFQLNVDDVPATARGGAVIFDGNGVRTISFTDGLHNGQRAFPLDVSSASPSVVTVDSLPAPRERVARFRRS